MVKVKSVLSNWPLFLGLLLGLYFIIFQMLGMNMEFMPGNLGDARFNIYILEHLHQYLFVSEAPINNYWDAPFMYPQESMISFSDNLLGTGIIYCGFRLLSFDIYTSFQLWFIVNTVLNYLFAYLFFTHLLKNKYASVLGAMVFAFSMALVNQYSHAQVFPKFCIPIAFLFALKFFKTLSVRHFFLTIFFVVYQFYCAVYMGFMLMLPIAFFLIITLIIERKKLKALIKTKWILGTLLAFVTNLLLLLPLIVRYMTSPATIKAGGVRKLHDISHVFPSIPTIKSFFFIRTKTIYWKFLNEVAYDLPSWWSHQLFIGATLILSILFLIIYTLKRVIVKQKIRKSYWVFFISGLITFLLFIRVGEYSLYSILYHFPGFGSLRSLQRIINVELLFFGFALAATFMVLFKKSKYQHISFVLLLGFFISDNYIYPKGFYRVEKQVASKRVEYLKEELKERPEVFSYEPVEKKELLTYYQLDAMLTAQELGIKTLNGYTSTVPVGYFNYSIALDEAGRKKWVNHMEITDDIYIVKRIVSQELNEIIEGIKKSPKWLKSVEEQATKRGITINEALELNAKWVFDKSEKAKATSE